MNRAKRAICKPEEQLEQKQIVQKICAYEEKHREKIKYREQRIQELRSELKHIDGRIEQLNKSIARKEEVLPCLETTLTEAKQKLSLN